MSSFTGHSEDKFVFVTEAGQILRVSLFLSLSRLWTQPNVLTFTHFRRFKATIPELDTRTHFMSFLFTPTKSLVNHLHA